MHALFVTEALCDTASILYWLQSLEWVQLPMMYVPGCEHVANKVVHHLTCLLHNITVSLATICAVQF